MAKVHRIGNTIIRVSDIVLAHIAESNPTHVTIGTKAGHSITFKHKTEEEALKYLNDLQKIMEGNERTNRNTRPRT